jgi:Zn-dependent protease with chaperone function
MRLQTLALLLFTLLATLIPPPVRASTTPTEAAAIAAARQDHTAYTLPPARLAKARRIARFYNTLYFVRAAWGFAALLLILQLGIAARLRNWAVRLGPRRSLQGFAFWLGLLTLLALLRLPLNMLSHREGVAFGFSVQGWPGWFADLAKSFALELLLGGLFVLLLFWLVRRSPRRWWLWLWFPTIVIVLFAVYIAPFAVDPLFNRFEPLSQADPALVAQLEKVAAHGGISIPPQRMFLMQASAKTTELNAYVTGFGASKRLVLWDTLLKKATPDEIAIIAGHEMGHYVLGHILRGTLISFFGILLAFFVGFHLFQLLLRRFGPRWGVPAQHDWAALVVMLLVLQLLTFFAEPIGNAFSRGMEHDADVFGQEIVHGIVPNPQATGQAAEQMLGESEYVEPDPSPFIEWWTGSHPSTSFRAAFARHYNPWAPGAEPKYFKH